MKKISTIALCAGAAGLLCMGIAAGRADDLSRIVKWPEIVLPGGGYMFSFGSLSENAAKGFDQAFDFSESVDESAEAFGQAMQESDKPSVSGSALRYDFPDNASIQMVRIQSDASNLLIRHGDKASLETEGLPEAGKKQDGYAFDYSLQAQDGLLTITISAPRNALKYKKSSVTLTLPETLREMNLYTGMGDVAVEGIACAKMTAETGLGDLDLNALKGDTYSMKTGMGDIDGASLQVKDAEFETGLGDIALQSTSFEKRLALMTGSGSIEAGLSENLDAVFCDLQTGLGKIKFMGKSVKGTSFQNGSPSASKKLEAETGMGDLAIIEGHHQEHE